MDAALEARKTARKQSKRAKRTVPLEQLRARELKAMKQSLPFLEAIIPDDIDNAETLYKAACGLIALEHGPARQAAYRTALRGVGTPEAERRIALSDLEEGIPYSSNIKKFPDIWNQALPKIREHQEAYGGAVFTESWPSLSRGRALTYYFKSHTPIGDVLHVAPEAEARAWFTEQAARYDTLDVMGKVDLLEDLTDLSIASDSYDLIICHRVLEHVFDETAALKEIKRILRTGGTFNVSVPESMHLPSTLEWSYPDATHHWHYRHYGSDFARRLETAGFEVKVVSWLLDQSREDLVRAGTFPFRMYNATA